MRILLLFFFAFFSICGEAKAAEKESVHQVYFSPNEDLSLRLIHLIDREKKEVIASTFVFSHREIASALLRAAKRGVAVHLLIDPTAITGKVPFGELADSGVNVYVWKGVEGAAKKRYPAVMHNKFCVFGGEILWTGSFNFTYAAAKSNCENVIVVRSKNLAGIYQKQFFELLNLGALTLNEYGKWQLSDKPTIKKGKNGRPLAA